MAISGIKETDKDHDSYEIKWGDTLSKIARARNTTVDSLAEVNGIKDPDKIMAGATILVPAREILSDSFKKGIPALPDAPFSAPPQREPEAPLFTVQDVKSAFTDRLPEAKKRFDKAKDLAARVPRAVVDMHLELPKRIGEYLSKGPRRSTKPPASLFEPPKREPLFTMDDVKSRLSSFFKEGIPALPDAPGPFKMPLPEVRASDVDYERLSNWVDEHFTSEPPPKKETPSLFEPPEKEEKEPLFTIDDIKSAVSNFFSDSQIPELPDASRPFAPTQVPTLTIEAKVAEFGDALRKLPDQVKSTLYGLIPGPENIKALVRFNVGNQLGLGSGSADIDVSNFDKDSQNVLRQAMDNATNAGRSYIKYSDYPDMRSGESVPDFYRGARKKRSLWDLGIESFVDPVLEMFTTTGVFNFKLLPGGGYEILPDHYGFSKGKSRPEDRREPMDDYSELVYRGQDVSEDQAYSFNVSGKISGV